MSVGGTQGHGQVVAILIVQVEAAQQVDAVERGGLASAINLDGARSGRNGQVAEDRRMVGLDRQQTICEGPSGEGTGLTTNDVDAAFCASSAQACDAQETARCIKLNLVLGQTKGAQVQDVTDMQVQDGVSGIGGAAAVACLEDKGVVARAAAQGVDALAAFDGVIASATGQGVSLSRAPQLVGARSAGGGHLLGKARRVQIQGGAQQTSATDLDALRKRRRGGLAERQAVGTHLVGGKRQALDASNVGKVRIDQGLQAHQLDGVHALAARQIGHGAQFAHIRLGTHNESIVAQAARQ